MNRLTFCSDDDDDTISSASLSTVLSSNENIYSEPVNTHTHTNVSHSVLTRA